MGTADLTLVEQLTHTLAQQIERHQLRAGSRLPSIRSFAKQEGVSPFTVAEAYSRLHARGLVEAKRGSGYFVRATGAAVRTSTEAQKSFRRNAAPIKAPAIDPLWLANSMFRHAPGGEMPGAGTLPREWLGADLVASAIRAVARSHPGAITDYGEPMGYRPLREQLLLQLAARGIATHSDQIVTTNGVTHALDLALRLVAAPGDTVFVEDSAWFIIFARLAAFGLRVIGVPRTADGLDLDALASLAKTYKPKALFINSIAHNPTGYSLTLPNAHRILQIAQQYDFTVIEDDVSSDLASESTATSQARFARLASLDGLERVIYLGGFSKTLATGIRVGFLAASPTIAQRLSSIKLLTGLTTAELGERAIYRVLTEGHYRTHCERLRKLIGQARLKLQRALSAIHFQFDDPLQATNGTGMFMWARLPAPCEERKIDSNYIATLGAQAGVICAPGSLFSATQSPSQYMRFAVGCAENTAAMKFLKLAMNE